jgi:hypothetical protein
MSDESADRTNPFVSKSIGKSDQRSNEKAKSARERANQHLVAVDSDTWPRGVNGQPMMKITMTASELIPTGQYANVSVGPAQITAFVDQDRLLEDGEFFSPEQRSVLAQALNELAEIVEGDVIAVQRNLVMESVQEQVKANNG